MDELWWFVLISLGGCVLLFVAEYGFDSEKVLDDCYDKHGSVILGVECEKEVRGEGYFWVFTFGFFMTIVGMLCVVVESSLRMAR